MKNAFKEIADHHKETIDHVWDAVVNREPHEELHKILMNRGKIGIILMDKLISEADKVD